MQIRFTLFQYRNPLLILSLLSILSDGLNGQRVDGKQVVRAELITGASDFSKPFLVGLRFTMEPGWYLYWKNPGDAGLPVEVKWSLPEGFTAGELQFPVPSKFVYDDLIAYGYKKELILLAEIRPSGRGQAPAFRANLDWLVCKESCIRGGAEVSLDASALKAPDRLAAGSMLAEWKNRLPKSPGPVSIVRPTVQKVKGKQTVSFALQGSEARAITDFYPLGLENAAIDYKSIAVKEGRVSFELTPYAEGETISRIKGLLIAGDRAYECEVTLPVL